MVEEPANEGSEEQPDSQLERNVQLELKTLKRLSRRSLAEEDTANEVITRTLDETAEIVTLDEIFHRIQQEFDDIGSIDVDHLVTHENPSQLIFWIHTGEANGLEDGRELFESNYLVVIERQEKSDVHIPFVTIATLDGPQRTDQTERTTVYIADTVVGAEPVDLDEGSEYLKSKLARPEEWTVGQNSPITPHKAEADS